MVRSVSERFFIFHREPTPKNLIHFDCNLCCATVAVLKAYLTIYIHLHQCLKWNTHSPAHAHVHPQMRLMSERQGEPYMSTCQPAAAECKAFALFGSQSDHHQKMLIAAWQWQWQWWLSVCVCVCWLCARARTRVPTFILESNIDT